jgi:hypothetical protein
MSGHTPWRKVRSRTGSVYTVPPRKFKLSPFENFLANIITIVLVALGVMLGILIWFVRLLFWGLLICLAYSTLQHFIVHSLPRLWF